MDGNLIVEARDFDLFKIASLHLLTIFFGKSRSANYLPAVAYSKGATFYREVRDGKSVGHVVGFTRDRNDLLRAIAVSRLVNGLTSSQFFADGRLLASGYDVHSVLSCLEKALNADDHRAHCYKVYPDQFQSLAPHSVRVDVKGNLRKKVILPCSMVSQYSGWVLSTEHPSSIQDQFQALAIQRGCDWCPLFNSKNLEISK